MLNKVKVGRLGENLVLHKYLQKGYELIAKNFQYYADGSKGRLGEIDLILLRGCVVVLVEVKTRTNLSFGNPLEQISRKQLLSLQKAFQAFLFKFPTYAQHNARFDVAIVMDKDVQIIENAYYF